VCGHPDDTPIWNIATSLHFTDSKRDSQMQEITADQMSAQKRKPSKVNKMSIGKVNVIDVSLS